MAAPVVVNAAITYPMVESETDVVGVGALSSPLPSTSLNALAAVQYIARTWLCNCKLRVEFLNWIRFQGIAEIYSFHAVFVFVVLASQLAVGFSWHFATFKVEINFAG